MDALSISSNVELNELDAYVASMTYIYLLVKGIMTKCIMEIIRNGVNTSIIRNMKLSQNCYHNSSFNIKDPKTIVIHGYANRDE